MPQHRNTTNQTLFHSINFLKITYSLRDEFTVKNVSNPCSKWKSPMIHIKMVFDGDSPVQPGKRCHNARGPARYGSRPVAKPF
jgi:hypothetical protein